MFFVARCDIHLDICPKILSLKWSRFGVIKVGSSKTLFLRYGQLLLVPYQLKAVTHIVFLAKSFQESTRRRFEKRRADISLSIELFLEDSLLNWTRKPITPAYGLVPTFSWIWDTFGQSLDFFDQKHGTFLSRNFELTCFFRFFDRIRIIFNRSSQKWANLFS